MSEKEELSKHKYIWYLYGGGDGTIHKERYPVIYANSSIVYYKKKRGTRLGEVWIQNVKDNPSEREIQSMAQFLCRKYYWNLPDNFDSMFMSAREEIKNGIEKAFVETTIRDYVLAKAAFEKAKTRYDALPDEIKFEKLKEFEM